MTPRFTALLLVFAFTLAAGCAKPADEANKSGKVAKARLFKADQDLQHLLRECDQYQAIRGELPAGWEAMGGAKIDPWGNEYAFEIEDGVVDIYSAGPDGEFDTFDDIRALDPIAAAAG